MQLREVLFWDTNPENVDWQKHADYVIERVARYGTLKEWKQVLAYYGSQKVLAALMKVRDLDAKTLNFLVVCFDVPKKAFRCYTEQPSRNRPFPS